MNIIDYDRGRTKYGTKHIQFRDVGGHGRVLLGSLRYTYGNLFQVVYACHQQHYGQPEKGYGGVGDRNKVAERKVG